MSGEADEEGSTDGSAKCAIYVHPGGDQIQSVDQGAVSAIDWTRQGKKGGADCLRTCTARKCRCAEVPDHPECDDARSGPIKADSHCLRRTGFPFKGGFGS